MSIGHEDPALHTAWELIKDICECGETAGEHEGRRKSIDSPPDGPCGATGCICVKFRRANLKVSRERSKR